MRIVLAIFVACWITSLPLAACTCDAPLGSFEEVITQRYRESAAVFSARAISVTRRPVKVKLMHGTVKTIPQFSARFLVEEEFKGSLGHIVEANTGTGAGDCSFGRIIEGAEYLIYADDSSKEIVHFSSCSGTSEKPASNSYAGLMTQYKREVAILRNLRRGITSLTPPTPADSPTGPRQKHASLRDWPCLRGRGSCSC